MIPILLLIDSPYRILFEPDCIIHDVAVKVRPDFSIERTKTPPVMGVDEAGRGPLAGPVVAAAVILDETALDLPINDSKKMSESQREKVYEVLKERYQIASAVIEPAKIDEINILEATMLAMRMCIYQLESKAEFILVDGNKAPIISPKLECIVSGDAKSITIAAASIVAKVERDRIMKSLSVEFPHYNWQKNKGYGTRDHMESLRRYGPCIYHRKSFIKNIAA